jgi:hypothetical protein
MSTFARSFDALIAVLIAFFAFGALVSLCGCTRPFWTTDETVYGVEFDWGKQEDRATVDTVLSRCADAIGGGRHLVGARVKFLDDPAAVTKACARPDPELVAGCWSTLLNDMVLLAVASRLVDTALCEELAHRARYYAKGQMVGAEDPWHCDRALWDELGVPETPGKCRH